jgi:hypothetical protein
LKLNSTDLNSNVLAKGSFFEIYFEKEYVVTKVSSNIKVNSEMYLEYLEKQQIIAKGLNRPYPSMLIVDGFISMDWESRKLAFKNRNLKNIYATAIVTPSVAFKAMMQLIVKLVGAKSTARAYFLNPEEAEMWLMKKRVELGHEEFTEEVIHACSGYSSE